jgi:integrase
MFLWVTPSGGKIWRWTYRHEGQAKLMTLGKYPDVPPVLARERHAARKLLATGVDPMAERKAEKASAENSFQSIAHLWLEHWQDGKSPRHVAYVKRRLETDILASLGARPIAAIEAPELVGMTKPIEQRGARDIAKRALESTGQVFRYAIANGFARRNPTSEIRPSDILKSARKVNYARVDVRELPSLLWSIEVYQGTHVTRLALKLMALTFVRTSELIGARWTEFDFDAARWNIPAERMKMRTPQIVFLARQALDVLDSCERSPARVNGSFPATATRVSQ